MFSQVAFIIDRYYNVFLEQICNTRDVFKGTSNSTRPKNFDLSLKTLRAHVQRIKCIFVVTELKKMFGYQTAKPVDDETKFKCGHLEEL